MPLSNATILQGLNVRQGLDASIIMTVDALLGLKYCFSRGYVAN